MASLRTAIDAKCRSCIYDPGYGGGGWREQVAACSSANCPLHPVRPQIGPESPRTTSQRGPGVSGYTSALPDAKIAAKTAQIGGANV